MKLFLSLYIIYRDNDIKEIEKNILLGLFCIIF